MVGSAAHPRAPGRGRRGVAVLAAERPHAGTVQGGQETGVVPWVLCSLGAKKSIVSDNVAPNNRGGFLPAPRRPPRGGGAAGSTTSLLEMRGAAHYLHGRLLPGCGCCRNMRISDDLAMRPLSAPAYSNAAGQPIRSPRRRRVVCLRDTPAGWVSVFVVTITVGEAAQNNTGRCRCI